MKILALDIGRDHTIACPYDSVTGNYKLLTLQPGKESLYKALIQQNPDRVVLEDSAEAGWVSEIANSLELEVHVAAPTEQPWRWRYAKRRSNRLNPLQLAKLSAENHLTLAEVPSRLKRQWKAITNYRSILTKRRSAIKNHIRIILAREGFYIPPGSEAWAIGTLQTLMDMARPLDAVNVDALWRAELWIELRTLEKINQSIEALEDRLGELSSE